MGSRCRPVGTLWALVTELGFSLDGLFASDEERPTMVQRADGRSALELAGGVVWERLSAAPDPDADFAFVTYPPGADSGADDPPSSHRGKEYGFVIGGRLEIEVGEQTLELGLGDAVVFGSETPHRFRALGDEPVTAVWLNLRVAFRTCSTALNAWGSPAWARWAPGSRSGWPTPATP